MKELGIIIMGLVCISALNYDLQNFGRPDYGFSPDFMTWAGIGIFGAFLYSLGKSKERKNDNDCQP